MSDDRQFAENLRVSLWRGGIAPVNWVEKVADWVSVPEARAQQLLVGEGGRPTYEELERIAAGSGHPAEDLLHGDLLEGVDILKENIGSLLATLPHGGQLEFAKVIGVNPTTVSRWATGKLYPRGARNLAAIRDYFHLPASVDIRSTPLFLELGPIGSIAKRQWLHERIESLPADELHELYPALQKLVR